ncbi:hypothetical protein [Pseudomonas protegens]|uniref:hypothetical protein n=1 Tax=Pseudomonas protegens TaxID=380021 RepID=UPI002776AA42|nr:hypothetical protein [Pseudomonas protegens]MDP9514669.1 hypothetical protein [Pseudomonas protegens]
MTDRYIVGSEQAPDPSKGYGPNYIPRGYQVYDNHEKRYLPDVYSNRPETQQECDRRNGR